MFRHKYSDCSYCGGIVKPGKIKVDLRCRGKLYLFENVPAGLCQQCGEKFFTAKVAKKMDYAIQKNRWRRHIEIPISSYTQIGLGR